MVVRGVKQGAASRRGRAGAAWEMWWGSGLGGAGRGGSAAAARARPISSAEHFPNENVATRGERCFYPAPDFQESEKHP